MFQSQKTRNLNTSLLGVETMSRDSGKSFTFSDWLLVTARREKKEENSYENVQRHRRKSRNRSGSDDKIVVGGVGTGKSECFSSK